MSEHTPFVTFDDTSELDSLEIDAQQAESDDLASLLQRREHARPTRLTWVLLTLLVLTIGFIGGAFASQLAGTSSSSAGMPAEMPAGMPTSFPSGAGFPGAGEGAGAAADTTTGTIKLVDGQSLYLTDSSGNTVKVVVPSTATVTSQSTVALDDLTAGTTVIVSGDTADDGTITATSVAEGSLPAATTAGASDTAAPTASALPSPTPSAQGAN